MPKFLFALTIFVTSVLKQASIRKWIPLAAIWAVFCANLFVIEAARASEETCNGLLSQPNDIVDVSKVVSTKPSYRSELGLKSKEDYLEWLKSPQVIAFYSTSSAYGEFSNFSRHPVMIGGRLYQTSEHYFQSQKFVGSPKNDVEAVRVGGNPKAIAAMGRDRTRPLRADWENMKDDVMRTAVEAKFFQHPELAALLLSTGDKVLVEHTENDRYWADNGDGQGPNRLGKILMETRALLKAAGGATKPLRAEERLSDPRFQSTLLVGLPHLKYYDPAYLAFFGERYQDIRLNSRQGFFRYFDEIDVQKILSFIQSEKLWVQNDVVPYSRADVEDLARKAGVSERTILRTPILLSFFAVPPDSTDPLMFLEWMRHRAAAAGARGGSLANTRRILNECVIVSARFALTPEHIKVIAGLVRTAVSNSTPKDSYEMRDDFNETVADEVHHYMDRELWGSEGLKR